MILMSNVKHNDQLIKIVLTGLTAALAYVVFTFLQIKIPIGGDTQSIHLGNAIVVLGALLLGPIYGGLGGAIGLSIGDLFDPVYVVSAPKTFIMKFLIGLIAGLIANKLGKITHLEEPKKYFKWVLIASAAALVFNAIFDPILGYFYKLLILGKPAAELSLSFRFATTSVNSVVSIIVSTLLYMAVRPALEKAHLLPKVK